MLFVSYEEGSETKAKWQNPNSNGGNRMECGKSSQRDTDVSSTPYSKFAPNLNRL